MTVPDGMRVIAVDPAITIAFITEPPGWTRLEPQSVSGDPTPGLEARIHDPLWLLMRQWQLGELGGADAGSPVSVEVTTATSDVIALLPGDPAANQPVRPWHAGDLLEPLVEQESIPTEGPGLRAQAEAGAQLVLELGEAGATPAMLAALTRDCALAAPAPDPLDPTGARLFRAVGGRVPDAEQAAAKIAAAFATTPPTPPIWFAGAADAKPLLDAAGQWLSWYRAAYPDTGAGTECWIDERLEYRFSLGLSGGAGELTLRAPAFSGGRGDWYDFDNDPTAAPLSAPVAAPPERTATLLANPLRYSAMPADRYWQFEDGQVNLGALQVQPHQIARLALAEFALIYGNDWLCLPVDVPYGSFTQVGDVHATDTFGVLTTVAPADDGARSGRFRLYQLSNLDGTESVAGLFVPPAAPLILTGSALEEVAYLRDETANMAWAVERRVQGRSGACRSREDEPRPAPFVPATDAGADMDYLLANEIPDWWIPLLPVATGFGTIALRKGAMVKGDRLVEPLGALLKPGAPLVLADEEVPREGVNVRRVPALARHADGTYARWITRRVTVGQGEGASGLAFDSAIRRQHADGSQ